MGNPWLDAGIVGLSTMRYGTDPDYWRKWFPADFITELFPGQFRNWFYSLLTMATALVTGQTPTRHDPGLCHAAGARTAAPCTNRGATPSSSTRPPNSPDFGADVMRWLFASQRYETDMLFGMEHAKEVRRSFLLPLWNVYSFFVTYANLDGWKPGGRWRTTAAPIRSTSGSWRG